MRYTTLPLIFILCLYMGCSKEDLSQPNYSKEVEQFDSLIKHSEKVIALDKRNLQHSFENGFDYEYREPEQLKELPKGFMNARQIFWSKRKRNAPSIYRNATVDDLPFPADHNYHPETFILDGESETSYNTQCLLSMMPEWTTSDYPSWDLSGNDTVSTEDLFALFDYYGAPEIEHINLDSITPVFSGFSSGIECWIDGPVVVDGIVLENVYCYLFRSGSDEEFLGGNPPYNDAQLNTFFLDIGIEETMRIYYRKY